MQGTVHGLDNYVKTWHSNNANHNNNTERRINHMTHRKGGRWLWSTSGGAGRGNKYDRGENGTEALVEGVMAWMRGWKDAEDGIRVRDLERREKWVDDMIQ